ncbi:MAG: family 16 glycoside hydrolase, partial [Planctomycetota bacterium]
MAAALLLALAALQSPPASPESQALDRISLFDGETLAGWRGDERFWGVEDGAIVGRSTSDAPCERTTYLVFEDATFANFELSLEYSIDGGNSGVQFRSVVSEDGAVSGYQADLEDGPNWTGGIYEQDGRGVLVRRGQDVTCAGAAVAWRPLAATVDLDALGGARAWHSYRIRAVGSTVELFIDGHRTARLDDRSPAARASGVVALQLHQGPPMEIRFRNVALRDLGSASSDPAPAPRWIWHPDGPERARTARFERTLSVALGLRRATLFATCDNGVEIAIDGEIRAAGDAWERPFEVDVTEHLTAGTHAIDAECWNAGGPAGFLARLTLEYEDGRAETVVSDASWTVPGVGPAAEIGPFGCAPWGVPSARSSGAPEGTLSADDLVLPPGFAAERLYTVPRAFGSWVALTVDERGRIVAAAEAHHGLFRLTLDEGAAPRVERLDLDVQGAQGLYARGDDLYVMRNEWDGGPNGLWRARDVDGDGAYETFELLQALDGGGEHGPHAILPTPGGDRLQVIAGNATALPAELARSRVAQRWSDDQVLPSLPDTFGHGNTMHLHGGWTATCDLDGGDWELVACGMRNAYDFAYDARGEAFAYDSDMEWDMGLPWYRAPRVLHLVPGAEFGWRRGSGKIPADAPETFRGVCDTGPASPVGVLHGAGGGFHPPFADRLFIGDWTRGRVLSVELEPDRGTYSGVVAPFVAGRPFPVTDMEWLPDGSMVIAIGGRGGRSALYRVWSTVGPSGSQRDVSLDDLAADGRRAALEKRVAFEARPDVAAWAPLALEAGSPEALLAVARVGGKELQAALVDAILAEPAALTGARLRAASL